MPNFPQGETDVLTAKAAWAAGEKLSEASAVAVDVEADAMHAFHARLCFVQVGTDEDIFLFDTLAEGVTPEPLASLFGDPSRTKYFHAAGGDLQYLTEAGVRVRGLFDTHRAATLLGWQKVGLADLARDLLQVELAKEHQQSDFSVRPLPVEVHRYIADDVRYLSEIGRQVREACRKADILEEVELDCLRMTDEAAVRPDLSALRPKLPRGSLSPSQYALALGIAKELHLCRLSWAEKANVPMGRMMSNAAISAIATRPPATLKELARAQGIRGAVVRDHGEEILSLIRELSEKAKKGQLLVEDAAQRAPPDPSRKRREDALRTLRQAKAAVRKVTPSVVLPNALLEELTKKPPRTLEELASVPYLGEKRARLYGAELLETLTKAG